MNHPSAHITLLEPPVIRAAAFVGNTGGEHLAYVEIDYRLRISSDSVDHLLAVADAFQSAARALRLEQVRSTIKAVAS